LAHLAWGRTQLLEICRQLDEAGHESVRQFFANAFVLATTESQKTIRSSLRIEFQWFGNCFRIASRLALDCRELS